MNVYIGFLLSRCANAGSWVRFFGWFNPGGVGKVGIMRDIEAQSGMPKNKGEIGMLWVSAKV